MTSSRHRRRLGPGGLRMRRRELPALAERLWRRPLGAAVALFAACGPVQALGYLDVVYWMVILALTLITFAVPLGMVGLLADRSAQRRGGPADLGSEGPGATGGQREAGGADAACEASSPGSTGRSRAPT